MVSGRDEGLGGGWGEGLNVLAKYTRNGYVSCLLFFFQRTRASDININTVLLAVARSEHWYGRRFR